VKGIAERFARLGVISTILRNKESRQRYVLLYDGFLGSTNDFEPTGMISSIKMVFQSGEALGITTSASAQALG